MRPCTHAQVRDLSGRQQLPLEPSASIWLCYDAEAMHKMRAIITGGTGREGGGQAGGLGGRRRVGRKGSKREAWQGDRGGGDGEGEKGWVRVESRH